MNSTTHDACNALRNCKPRSHDDLMTLVAVFATAIKQSQILSSKASGVVLDMLACEVTGQIEQDKIDKQAEAMWADTNQRAWNLCQDVPGFAGTYANLGALNLQQEVV